MQAQTDRQTDTHTHTHTHILVHFPAGVIRDDVHAIMTKTDDLSATNRLPTALIASRLATPTFALPTSVTRFAARSRHLHILICRRHAARGVTATSQI